MTIGTFFSSAKLISGMEEHKRDERLFWNTTLCPGCVQLCVSKIKKRQCSVPSLFSRTWCSTHKYMYNSTMLATVYINPTCINSSRQVSFLWQIGQLPCVGISLTPPGQDGEGHWVIYLEEDKRRSVDGFQSRRSDKYTFIVMKWTARSTCSVCEYRPCHAA